MFCMSTGSNSKVRVRDTFSYVHCKEDYYATIWQAIFGLYTDNPVPQLMAYLVTDRYRSDLLSLTE